MESRTTRSFQSDHLTHSVESYQSYLTAIRSHTPKIVPPSTSFPFLLDNPSSDSIEYRSITNQSEFPTPSQRKIQKKNNAAQQTSGKLAWSIPSSNLSHQPSIHSSFLQRNQPTQPCILNPSQTLPSHQTSLSQIPSSPLSLSVEVKTSVYLL